MTTQVVLVLRKAADFESLLKRLDTIAQPHDDVALLLHCEHDDPADQAQLQKCLEPEAALSVCSSDPHATQFPAAETAAFITAARQRWADISVYASTGKLAAVIESYSRRATHSPLIFLALEKTWMVSR